VDPQTLDKTPTQDVSVNKPASGTYGEGAANQRLQQAIPPLRQGAPGQPQGPGQPGQMPGRTASMPGQAGRPVNGPPGVPNAVLSPTSRPNVPLNTPLVSTASPVATASDATAARIAVLRQLANSDQVSAVTRRWAQYVLEMLDAAGKQ